MIRSRRSMLIVGAAGVAASVAETFAKADAFQSPQYRPSPNAPTNPNAPAGNERAGDHSPRQEHTRKLQSNADRGNGPSVYKLSGELQDEVDHTDLKATFPLTVVKKAQQIEKLAKQIKDHAKG